MTYKNKIRVMTKFIVILVPWSVFKFGIGPWSYMVRTDKYSIFTFRNESDHDYFRLVYYGL